MKKIILILALLSLGVSKAQVVGGYLPVNSTKSATMGGLRVNGTSTFTGNALFSSSVGVGALPTSSLSSLRVINSTSTVDIGRTSASAGAIWLQQSSPTSANYALNSDGSVVQLNSSNSGVLNLQVNTVTKLGLNTGGATVTGSLVTTGTHSLGSANLTGGNTGTVAVLSDALFQITFNSPSTNPADGVTYYFSNLNFPAQQTSTGGTVTIPYNCTLVGWDFNMSVTGTVGSAETATLVAMANNATVSVLSTAITFSNVTGYQGFSATGLSTNFTAGDKFNIRMVSPTWATNPTQVFTGITLWFVRRS